MYTPGVETIALDPPNVQLEGSGVNDTVKPFSWTEIAFLGTKSVEAVPDAQYKASPFSGTPQAMPQTSLALCLEIIVGSPAPVRGSPHP